MSVATRQKPIPADWDRRGLPGWSYHSQALFELEKDHVFLNHWQIVCHVNDVAEPGSYLSFDMLGERALIVRDAQGRIGAFHNICRHRGSRLVAEERGKCRNALVCPFHGWVYNLDGTLRGAARPESFPELDKLAFGLAPLESEIWNGLIFVRFRPGPQGSVASLMAGFAEELAHYDIENLVPAGAIWTQESPVNWKSVRDVDNEGYHVAMAHPALQDLYGSTYFDIAMENGVSSSHAVYNAHGGRRWSVRHYLAISPEPTHLPGHLHRTWAYYGLFPNSVIAVTPQTVQFYQEFPLAPNRSLLRGCVYRRKEESRAERAARYLAHRIDRDTAAEDVQLTIWSNEAMLSKAFRGFYLSDLEYGVRTHHDHLRSAVPVLTLEEAPAETDMAALNARLLSGQAEVPC